MVASSVRPGLGMVFATSSRRLQAVDRCLADGDKDEAPDSAAAVRHAVTTTHLPESVISAARSAVEGPAGTRLSCAVHKRKISGGTALEPIRIAGICPRG